MRNGPQLLVEQRDQSIEGLAPAASQLREDVGVRSGCSHESVMVTDAAFRPR